jgi:hypothetical protein
MKALHLIPPRVWLYPRQIRDDHTSSILPKIKPISYLENWFKTAASARRLMKSAATR